MACVCVTVCSCILYIGCSRGNPEKSCSYLVLFGISVVLCLIPASFSSSLLPHPSKSSSSFAGTYNELGADGGLTLPDVLIKSWLSQWEAFLLEGKTDHGILLPNTKKFPTWKINKMLGRHWSGIIYISFTQIWSERGEIPTLRNMSHFTGGHGLAWSDTGTKIHLQAIPDCQLSEGNSSKFSS